MRPVCKRTSIIPPTVGGFWTAYGCGCRFVQRAKGLVKEQVRTVQQTCRSRLRSARQAAQTLHRQLRRKGEEKEAEQKKLYEKLIQTAEQMVRQSRQVVSVLSQR